MRIDLRKITVKDIEEKMVEIALDYQGLANYIFNQTKDIGELELARDLYKKGIIEITPKDAEALKTYIHEAFNASVHEAIFPKLDSIINSKK